jgi:chromosome segregation ATPase
MIDDLHNLDHDIHTCLATLKNIQGDIAEVNALCDKYKSEALHYHKAHQVEVMKNNEMVKILGQA